MGGYPELIRIFIIGSCQIGCIHTEWADEFQDVAIVKAWIVNGDQCEISDGTVREGDGGVFGN